MDVRLAFVWLFLSFIWLIDYAVIGTPVYVVIAVMYQVLALVTFLHGEHPK